MDPPLAAANIQPPMVVAGQRCRTVLSLNPLITAAGTRHGAEAKQLISWSEPAKGKRAS